MAHPKKCICSVDLKGYTDKEKEAALETSQELFLFSKERESTM